MNGGDLQVNKEREHCSYYDGHLCNEIIISSVMFIVMDEPGGSYDKVTKRSEMFRNGAMGLKEGHTSGYHR